LVADRVGGGRQELLLRHLGEAVLERRAAEAVAVRDLDDRHACRGQPADHGADLLRRELVRHGVAAIAQRGIADTGIDVARYHLLALTPALSQGERGFLAARSAQRVTRRRRPPRRAWPGGAS